MVAGAISGDIAAACVATQWSAAGTAVPVSFIYLHRLSGSPWLASYDQYRIGQEDNNLLVQGVMMHEFAHCLHVSRDMPAFDQKVIGTRSLAPVNAREVKDIERYLEAEKSFKTWLWREVVADTFAVGYWKLTAPETATGLVATLRRKRADEEGTQHATKCWIDYADQTAAPPSIATLFEWADQLRTSPPCELS